MINIDTIEHNVREWVKDNISSDFKFRQYQLETIVYIIKRIMMDNIETSIIEAPTGSGKSLISLIAAGVLSKYHNIKSYILCSDLFLWQQYADSIDNYNLKDFGYLKGSIGNYTCHVNKQDFSCAKCRLAKISLMKLRDTAWRKRNFYSCYDTCEYMKQRERAEKSKVTLLTYQLWLHHMNLVNAQNGESTGTLSFPKRDVIFCDECHNIPDIVQQFCSPSINEEKDKSKLLEIVNHAIDNECLIPYIQGQGENLMNIDFLKEHGEETKRNKYLVNEIYDVDKIKQELNILFDSFDVFQDNQKKVQDILDRYFDVLVVINYISSILSEELADEISTNKKDKDKDSTSLKMSKLFSWLDTYCSGFKTFIIAINHSSPEYLLLETSMDEETRVKTFSFKCAKEDYLCWKYLLNHANYKVMMSATVGLHSSFDDNIGITYTEQKASYLVRLPSTFNYEKSPIYFIPTYKMNYKNKQESLPKIAEMVTKIIAANDCRGIIHTGSYENARFFYNNMPKELRSRLLLYGNSRQKEEIIDEYKYSKNKVLVGPTLMEGIDLPNDLCRFIILMKVPYPNITGKLVKKKMELFPSWYNSTTSNSIIQSIGRGVRNENDYCTTYILDGCFGALYEQTKEQYPQNIKNRLKIIRG